ncbi:ABC-2 transporter permease [Ruania halotolerans]|uniref:ABC-2 transporter permease n=1 Tax=Ruania halotolerans TaxID=2897773 RepID=UPI001E6147EE|nr:ABC-2 transporter permease [Ruania halotolerans]UFU06305.1 ABC-2 transporter permease [Ruania halotolerans]
MSAMSVGFARFDLLSWFPRKQTLLTLAFVVVIGILLPVPGMAIIAAAVVTSLMVSAPFLGDEQGRLDTLYGVLPVSRASIVVGRAASLLTYYLTAAALATVTTVVVSATRGDEPAADLLLVAHAAAAAIVGIALGLQMPVFFRIGYSRGRLMAYAPTVVIAGGAWLLQAIGWHTPVLEAFSGVPVTVLLGAGLAVGLAGVILGVVISARLYRTRDL